MNNDDIVTIATPSRTDDTAGPVVSACWPLSCHRVGGRVLCGRYNEVVDAAPLK